MIHQFLGKYCNIIIYFLFFASCTSQYKNQDLILEFAKMQKIDFLLDKIEDENQILIQNLIIDKYESFLSIYFTNVSNKSVFFSNNQKILRPKNYIGELKNTSLKWQYHNIFNKQYNPPITYIEIKPQQKILLYIPLLQKHIKNSIWVNNDFLKIVLYYFHNENLPYWSNPQESPPPIPKKEFSLIFYLDKKTFDMKLAKNQSINTQVIMDYPEPYPYVIK